MCTVSWIAGPEGFDLLCNRDEKRTRARAEAPRVRFHRGVRCIAPVDPVGGGTWIGVNEFGVAACLLNGPMPGGAGALSRGMVVRDVLHHLSALAAAEEAMRRDLTSFGPFTILFLEPAFPPVAAVWNGHRRLLLPDASRWNPLTSSSMDARRAATRRRAAFPRAASPESLRMFHTSHSPEPGPYSVCMHRADAETVSFSHIRVSPERVEFEYQDGPPCCQSLARTVTMRRIHAGSTRSLHAAC